MYHKERTPDLCRTPWYTGTEDDGNHSNCSTKSKKEMKELENDVR